MSDTDESLKSIPVGKPEIAVLVSGTTGMGLEILAGRIIAPEFGSTIYTWGSIIGVFLAGLSLGYYNGGKRTRIGVSYGMIRRHFLGAAVYIAFLMVLSEVLLRYASAIPVPARFSPLIPVLLLFGPPAYILGFVSPYSAQLSKKESKGEAAGHIFAVGTVGSIIGAFSTTFFLIPWLSVEVIELGFGMLLIGGALAMIDWSNRKERREERREGPKKLPSIVPVVLVLLLLLGSFAGAVYGLPTNEDVVYETQTPYQYLKVVDDDGVRTLYLNDQPQSAMDLDEPNRHVFDYTRYFHLPFLVTEDEDEIKDVLFIGGGGFTGPKIFEEKYDVSIDAVEIDPDVVRTAERYFSLEESDELDVHQMDGREFLEGTNKRYDLIVLDAYKKDKVPFHLTTREFMQLGYSKLDDDGVLMMNLISAPEGSGSKFYRAEYKTVDRVFPQVYSFKTSSTSYIQNIEIVATKNPEKVSKQELLRRNTERDIGINLSHEIGFYQTEVNTKNVPVLKDDKAPVERLLDPMIGRKYVIEKNATAGNRSAESPG